MCMCEREKRRVDVDGRPKEQGKRGGRKNLVITPALTKQGNSETVWLLNYSIIFKILMEHWPSSVQNKQKRDKERGV